MALISRRRKGFSLVEAVVAMLVLSIAIFAVIEVFISALRITTASSVDSMEVVSEYATFQRTLTGTNPGVFVRDVQLVFKNASGEDSPVLSLKRYTLGDRVRLPIYAP